MRRGEERRGNGGRGEGLRGEGRLLACSVGRKELRRSHGLGRGQPVGRWRAGGPRAARGLVVDVVSMRGDEKRVFSLLRRGARPTEPQAGLGGEDMGEERVRSGCASAMTLKAVLLAISLAAHGVQVQA